MMKNFLRCIAGVGLAVALPALAQVPVGGASTNHEAVARAIAAAMLVKGVTLAQQPDGSAGITIQLQNTGAKAIYAFTISYVGTYPDGTHSTQNSSADLLMVYASADAPHLQPVSLLRPGETYTDHGYMPAKDGVTPSGVTPEVTMLVFEDGMALGEPGALQFVSKFRRSMADKYAAAAVDLRVIAGSSDRAGAAEELLRTLRDATATRPPRGQNYDSYNINSYRLQRLQQVRTWVADQDRLELEIKEQERFEAFARSHSDLTMGVIQ